MPGPAWNADEPTDSQRILDNIDDVLRSLNAAAPVRSIPDIAEVQRWHAAIYDGCHLPVPGYAGHFRGDPSVPELVGYEVGVGVRQRDGFPDRVGLPSDQVPNAVAVLLAQLANGASHLDGHVAVGSRPADPAVLQSVASLAATIHGEWVRIHPYANGNGRTARLWAAWLALRYRLPVFVTVKPRPADVDYARSSRLSMGRPPDYTGDHRPAALVFAAMLSRAIGP